MIVSVHPLPSLSAGGGGEEGWAFNQISQKGGENLENSNWKILPKNLVTLKR